MPILSFFIFSHKIHSSTILCHAFVVPKYSFRSYSSSRNHQRRSPTSVSSVRSSSYHSPTRCSSPINSTQQQANVISRPSSPAASSGHSSRHSTYAERERSGSIHHPSVSRTPSHSSQTGVESNDIGLVVREPRDRREMRNERSSTVQTSCVPGSPAQNSASVHHRANSGPTIAISMIHDPDTNSGKSSYDFSGSFVFQKK